MRYFLIISAIALLSFGASGSNSNQSYILITDIPLEYNTLIKTSEEMYKTSEELLNKVKNLP